MNRGLFASVTTLLFAWPTAVMAQEPASSAAAAADTTVPPTAPAEMSARSGTDGSGATSVTPPTPAGSSVANPGATTGVGTADTDAGSAGAPTTPEPVAAPAVNEDGESRGGDGDPLDGGADARLSAMGLSFRFLMQTQYVHTFGVDSSNPDVTYREPENELGRSGDGWDLNRLYLRISAKPTNYLALKMVTDLAELRHDKPKKAVKQAHVDLSPLPKHLHFLVGVLKLPYSIHELDSTARYEFTSSGEANGLVSDLGFAGRDVGALVAVTPLSKPRYLRLSAGAFRGHADDQNASPVGAFGGRLSTEPVKGLRFGGSFIQHPKTVVEKNALDTKGKDLLPDPDDIAYPRARTWKKGSAFGADATFHRSGLMLRTEAMMGDRVDYDTRYGAERWAAIWGIAAYRFDAGPVELEPGLRAEWLDTDSQNEGGLYRQLTFGVGTYLSQSTRILFDVTRMDVEDDSPVVDQPRPLREVPYNALSRTTVTGQLQVVL